ncbi:hypothetical protein BP6252_06807 [Coleophoma cylindrospora]|uniref:Uncharacterized protein n=1 Tax=Coleophoma cylindrospora TaxID=1849047 RepID=A0A3D8RG16_9HELO|nr:hypothetical protein BP6252_06807 [Coleophoma cylindrospora]
MQLSQVAFLATLVVGVMADMHHVAACTGTDYVWGSDINSEATSCACWNYQRRNTGNNWWDKCPDCAYDGTYCNSKFKHIGGDEFNYYCTKKCGAKNSIAD